MISTWESAARVSGLGSPCSQYRVTSPPLLAGCDVSVVDLHAEPKGSHPRPVGKACWHLGSGKQVEKRDREVGSVINAWGLLGSGLKGIDRNRRVSNALSPIFYLFLEPASPLYLKVQEVLAHNEAHDAGSPPIIGKRRQGPKKPK